MEADDPVPIIRTATEAIAATLRLGTVAYEAERDADEQINELRPVVDRDGDERQSAAGRAVEQPESTLFCPSRSSL